MKNLLAIFLATALLVGCGGTTPESDDKNNFSQEEWESLVEWCVTNRWASDGNCGDLANAAEKAINKRGANQDCIVSQAKRMASSYSSYQFRNYTNSDYLIEHCEP
jgi:hypothetical protein